MTPRITLTTLQKIVITVLGVIGAVIGLFVIKQLVDLSNSDFIRIVAGAFTGSSTAGIIYYLIRQHLDYLPLQVIRDHVIVCGLNFRSDLIIQDLVRNDNRPVIIENDVKNPYTESWRSQGLIVVPGSPASAQVLTRAGIQRARYVISFDEKDENNAEVALMALQLVPKTRNSPLTCIIQILNHDLFMMMRKQTFSPDTTSSVKIEFFNQYALGARALLDQYPPFVRNNEDNQTLPVLIIGAGKLGESLIVRITRTWYLHHREDQTRLNIVLVDLHADQIRENLLSYYPKISAACDFTSITTDVQAAAFQRGDLLRSPVFSKGFIAYICFDDDSLGLFTALTLHHFAEGKKVQCIVRMDHNTSVAKLISTEHPGMGTIPEIHPVNIYELTANSRVILAGEEEILARSVHENYYINERDKELTEKRNQLLVSWDRLGELTLIRDGIDGESYRNSNRGQAHFIWTKLSLMGYDIGPIIDWDAPLDFSFTEKETEYLSRLEHDRWMQEKIRQGWRFGSERNEREKIHPSLIPYEQLSEMEKQKDRDTIHQIPQLLSLIDFQIYRV